MEDLERISAVNMGLQCGLRAHFSEPVNEEVERRFREESTEQVALISRQCVNQPDNYCCVCYRVFSPQLLPHRMVAPDVQHDCSALICINCGKEHLRICTRPRSTHGV